MLVKVWPHNRCDGGILCMPLIRNVPEPRNGGWRQTICPNCGADCWETDLCREAMEDEGLLALCTECAVRIGLRKERKSDG